MLMQTNIELFLFKIMTTVNELWTVNSLTHSFFVAWRGSHPYFEPLKVSAWALCHESTKKKMEVLNLSSIVPWRHAFQKRKFWIIQNAMNIAGIIMRMLFFILHGLVDPPPSS